MKRQRPQILPFLSAERSFTRLVSTVFVAVLLVSALPAARPSGFALGVSSTPDSEEANLSRTELSADSVRAERQEKPLVPAAEAAETPESTEKPSESAPATAEARMIARGLSPFLTFAAIERAWNAGCADSIKGFFPEEKITLHLETNVPEGATFSRQQACYMLKDALGYTVTESFQFLEFRYDKSGEASPSGNAEWSYRREPEGEIMTKSVHLTLRKDGERWLISEIGILD
jgi:hypothetical protein